MTKINKKCKDCTDDIEQVFCHHDSQCEVDRIERRVPNFTEKSINKINKDTNNEIKINKSVIKCKGNGKSLIAVPLTIF